MKFEFTKMQGCGNDYIYFDCMKATDEMLEKIISNIPSLSDRHFGIGGDGVVLILPAEKADVQMRMFNADGSEGAMCGNASRCVGKYVYEKGYVKGAKMSLQTKSGVKEVELHIKSGVCVGATVNMGLITLLDTQGSVSVDGKDYDYTGVSVGNPHAVIFVEENVKDYPVCKIGVNIEKHPTFKDGINVEFVNRLEDNNLAMRVWERGSGETLACGTGSCAVAYAAVRAGFVDANKPITIHLIGGELVIELKQDVAYMTGAAETAFVGQVELG